MEEVTQRDTNIVLPLIELITVVKEENTNITELLEEPVKTENDKKYKQLVNCSNCNAKISRNNLSTHRKTKSCLEFNQCNKSDNTEDINELCEVIDFLTETYNELFDAVVNGTERVYCIKSLKDVFSKLSDIAKLH